MAMLSLIARVKRKGAGGVVGSTVSEGGEGSMADRQGETGREGHLWR